MQKIIDIVKTNKKVGFLYLSPAVPKSSVHYHYYNLKSVPPTPLTVHHSQTGSHWQTRDGSRLPVTREASANENIIYNISHEKRSFSQSEHHKYYLT